MLSFTRAPGLLRCTPSVASTASASASSAPPTPSLHRQCRAASADDNLNQQAHQAKAAGQRRKRMLDLVRSQKAQLEAKKAASPSPTPAATPPSPSQPSRQPQRQRSDEREGTPWKSEILPSSPGGKVLHAELARIMRTKVQAELLGMPINQGTSAFLPCVFIADAHPKIAYAYDRARVSMQTNRLSVLLVRFLSHPTTIYAVYSTHPKGAYSIVRSRHRRGLSLGRADILLGPHTNARHSIEFPFYEDATPAERKQLLLEADDAESMLRECEEGPAYVYLNTHGAIHAGPPHNQFGDAGLEILYRQELLTKRDRVLPEASLSGVEFDWGNHSCTTYVQPVDADASEGEAEMPAMAASYGAQRNVFHPMSCLRESEQIGHAPAAASDAPPTSMLHLRNPDAAERAHALQMAKLRSDAQALRAQAGGRGIIGGGAAAVSSSSSPKRIPFDSI